MRNKNTKRNIALITVAMIVIVGATLFALEKSNTISLFGPGTPPATTEENNIKLEPPTDEEKKAGDEQKDENIKEEEQRNNQEPNNKTASVVITDAGQYDNVIEVRSFIPDHYQDGTCTITLAMGNQTVTKETPAYRDATTTICTNPLIERSEFPTGGEWQVVVSYHSADATGQSEPATITIN